MITKEQPSMKHNKYRTRKRLIASRNMFSDVLGKPVKIQGQDVIILPDIVGAVPVTEQHEYVEIAKAA